MKTPKIRIHFIFRLLLFWMLYFALFRISFIIYHHARILDGQHSETGLSFLYGLRLDLSAATGAIIIPFILWVFQQFYKSRLIHLINLGYNFLLITLVAVLSVINLKVYGEWGTLLGTRALKYFLSPKEVLSFISFWSVLLLIVSSGVFAYMGIKSYRRYITNFSSPIENPGLKWAYIMLVPVFIIVALRGGLQNIPVNETTAAYSDFPINNIIATNNIWYLAHTFLDPAADADFFAPEPLIPAPKE